MHICTNIKVEFENFDFWLENKPVLHMCEGRDMKVVLVNVHSSPKRQFNQWHDP